MKAILRFQLPATVGSDLAGVVLEVGHHVTRFKPGDAVLTSFVLVVAKAGLKGIHRQDCRRHSAHHSPLYQDKAVTPTSLKDIFYTNLVGSLCSLIKEF